MDRMEKIDSSSLDLEAENIKKLKQLFPSVVSEGKIDFELLREILGDQVDEGLERYEFSWPGKKDAIRLAQLKSTSTLIPCKSKSVDWSNTHNLYLEGDNLEVLKQLQKTYFGKVNVIYIDPPYNTGKDFIYNDKFNINQKEYIEKTNQGLVLNPETSGRFHTNWLNMLFPRIMLARNLLASTGVIFVSIDDNELFDCKKILDEIFGESNFVANIVRNTNSSKNQSLFVSVSHEYCLIYAKDMVALKEKHKDNKWGVDKNNVKEYIKKVEQMKKEGLSSDEITKELKILTNYPRFIDFTNYWYFDERGLYRKGDLGGVSNGNTKPLFNPITMKEDPVPPGGYRYGEEKLKELVAENRIHFHSDGSLPTIKRYLSENIKQRPKSIMSDDQRPDYAWLKKNSIPFDNPKQLTFMKRILSIFDKDSIILDFFAGSSTTAHAVMELNADDGGERKFIMIQLPEEIDHAKYKNVCEIGEDRIRFAAKEIKNRNDETLFSKDIDLGFKIFKLKSSNIMEWDNTKRIDNLEVLLNQKDTFKIDRTKEDILYEIMLKYGIFDMDVNEIEINNKEMYRIGGRYMIVCLEDNIDSEDIKAIAELHPKVVVFKDNGFKNDNVKINAMYNLKNAGVEDVKSI